MYIVIIIKIVIQYNTKSKNLPFLLKIVIILITIINIFKTIIMIV